MTESLTTFAPVVERAERLHPTGNLLVSLPELDESGCHRSVNVVSEAERGVVAAVGHEDGGLLAPSVIIDGVERRPGFTWSREADWLPRGEALVAGGAISVEWVTPISRGGTSDAGLAARLDYRNETTAPQHVRLAWSGRWAATVVHHFRAKQLALSLQTRDDAWTGCRAVYAGSERLLLSLSWRPGEGARFVGAQPENGWLCSREAILDAGESLELDVYIGVATEPDGSGATALYLRRTGYDALRASTVSWLDAHGPRFGEPRSPSASQRPAHRSGPPRSSEADGSGARPLSSPKRHGRDSRGPAGSATEDLERVARLNAFFSHFFAQADCLDTGRTVLLTSRSPRYYVSGAFWSRDAYWWSFPALLLVDPVRARRGLVASLENAGSNVAHHALYITGQRLYPGFELDELVAPVLALWRYVDATQDESVIAESAVQALLETVARELAEMSVSREGVFDEAFVTTLLPTDDPTDFPITATGNALVAVALEAIGRLTGDDDALRRGCALRDRLSSMFVHEPGGGAPARWAWAIDLDGKPEWRDEPPLGLRLLPYLGLAVEGSDAASHAFAESLRWLVTDYAFHYAGAFPGAGAPHFASPSAFDLGNRVLTGNHDLGDPLVQLATTPMDAGIACESWDPGTGIVVTGQAMASVAGYLAWTAWADAVGHRRWDDSFPLPGSGTFDAAEGEARAC